MRRGATIFLVAVAMLVAGTSAALAAEAPGPAFVDELGSQLQPIRDAGPGDRAAAKASGLTLDDGEVLVDVVVNGDDEAAAGRLEELGMTVLATAAKPRPVVEGTLPLDALADAARAGYTEAVLPVIGYGTDSEGGTDVGAATSQGVTRHNMPAAIASAGTSGAGVEVGVISDSINQVGGGVAGSQASGDLPANVSVLLDDTTPGASDEGRAMAEIVYDMAPGISRILFSTGTLGSVVKAQSIDNLVANGSDLIVDDIFYLSEPFFQDGVIAQAVDRARAAGVPYLASAGNRARQSYESTYRTNGGVQPNEFHDFDPGAGTETLSCFTNAIPNGGVILVALGWDEPVGGVTTDLDLRLTDPTGVPTLDAALSDNIATGDPKEIVSYQHAGPSITPCIEIQRFAGVRAPAIKWIQQDNNLYAAGAPEFDTASDTINPDAASAQGSLAVAAVSQGDPGLNTPRAFSSRGPKTRLFDVAGNRLATPLVLNKPQLAAADAVTTTVPGFAPFNGTSAAAPSAAGIVALLRATNPQASVNEIYAQMTDPANAIECTSSAVVPDPDCGAGFILADRAVAALDRTPASPTLITNPVKPNGRKRWFTKKNVAVSWDTTDPESPTESTSGCDPVFLSAQGIKTFSCTVTSGGGPGTTTEKVKHDSKKPKKPKIRGIEDGETYSANQLPPKKKVRKCKSKDKTSGLKSCKVKGYSDESGKHKLKATATDKAGLRKKASLTYRVR